MAIRKFNHSFAAPTSVSTGTNIVDLQASISNHISLASVGTATYKVMVSFDGTTYVQYGASLTADADVALPDAALKVRVDCSAYTSGTPTCGVAGLLSNQ